MRLPNLGCVGGFLPAWPRFGPRRPWFFRQLQVVVVSRQLLPWLFLPLWLWLFLRLFSGLGLVFRGQLCLWRPEVQRPFSWPVPRVGVRRRLVFSGLLAFSFRALFAHRAARCQALFWTAAQALAVERVLALVLAQAGAQAAWALEVGGLQPRAPPTTVRPRLAKTGAWFSRRCPNPRPQTAQREPIRPPAMSAPCRAGPAAQIPGGERAWRSQWALKGPVAPTSPHGRCLRVASCP